LQRNASSISANARLMCPFEGAATARMREQDRGNACWSRRRRGVAGGNWSGLLTGWQIVEIVAQHPCQRAGRTRPNAPPSPHLKERVLKQIRKRLTYANVMSSLAVFLVLGGATAFAAGHLGKNTVGTKQLKKNAVTTAKIKKHAVTGAKIKLSSLGAVPSATNASHASTADKATNSDHADVATNADNAGKLGGSPPSAFLSSSGVRADGNGISSPLNDFTTTTFTDLVSKGFTAPSAGFIYLTGSVSTEDDVSFAGGGWLLFRLTLDGTSLTENVFAHAISTSLADNVAAGSGSTTAVVPVSAGAHTVALQAKEAGTGDYVEGREVSALFVPNGSGVSIPIP